MTRAQTLFASVVLVLSTTALFAQQPGPAQPSEALRQSRDHGNKARFKPGDRDREGQAQIVNRRRPRYHTPPNYSRWQGAQCTPQRPG